MTDNKLKIKVPTMAEMAAAGKKPEWLFWVGSAGAFDDRYKKVTREFVKILAHYNTFPDAGHDEYRNHECL